MIGQNLRVSDIPLSEGMRLVTAPDTVISHVVALRAAVTVEAEPAPVAATPEPEVIKKGKKEEEGAEKKDEKTKK